MNGEVVGINSQIFTRSGGFMGLSFAIPIDVALDVSNQLKKDGKVSRGWLGVVIREVNKDLAESFGLDKPAGALVAQVLEDGPAAKGGLQVGDVILSMNGQPIIMSADLPHLVGSLRTAPRLVWRSSATASARIWISPSARCPRTMRTSVPALEPAQNATATVWAFPWPT